MCASLLLPPSKELVDLPLISTSFLALIVLRFTTPIVPGADVAAGTGADDIAGAGGGDALSCP